MTERATRLHAIADGQIAELSELISTVDEATLRLPCPGREKLGDGTIAASARHTAANYQRIASFVQANGRLASAPAHGQHGERADLVVQLAASRDVLQRIAELTDGQLDAVPPKDSFRFCDGQRTFEQVLAALLKHQGHQLEALKRAVA